MLIHSVLFRFDAASEIGLGHAFRCAALIEHINNYYSKDSLKCVVISKGLPGFLQKKLTAMGADVVLLDDSLSITAELEQISTITKNFPNTMLILDGYQFDQCYRQKLALLNNNLLKIAVFDDTNDLEKLYCHLVINALPDAEKLGYQYSAPNAQHLLGLSYSIVRQEYLSQKSTAFTERNLIVINFGGSDIGGLTLPVIKGVAEVLKTNNLDYSAKDIVVITGGGCQGIENIQLFCKKMNFRHVHQCENMAELLSQSRLAICAPGAIVYELAYCQVPSLFLTVADNQLLSAKAHQEAGWSYVFDGRCASGMTLALNKLSILWQDNQQLEKMSASAADLVDGKGVTRIVEVLVNILHPSDIIGKAVNKKEEI
ncbi:MAG: UDP-2,4-diacetamido-2,4,6-trideoxy-beta-L-altropyranose hydrolase [Colwellia sp.]|nr:UDP-2,4-diacetamido-2,4,6-trideoxy-beta-L-altropyranose hydrolase [Colwellia sp.]